MVGGARSQPANRNRQSWIRIRKMDLRLLSPDALGPSGGDDFLEIQNGCRSGYGPLELRIRTTTSLSGFMVFVEDSRLNHIVVDEHHAQSTLAAAQLSAVLRADRYLKLRTIRCGLALLLTSGRLYDAAGFGSASTCYLPSRSSALIVIALKLVSAAPRKQPGTFYSTRTFLAFRFSGPNSSDHAWSNDRARSGIWLLHHAGCPINKGNARWACDCFC
jgi:hypothetical protein